MSGLTYAPNARCSRRRARFAEERGVNGRRAVAEGDVAAVIGPSGGGKSTLLKILSRITDPTTGVAEIRGRVAAGRSIRYRVPGVVARYIESHGLYRAEAADRGR